MIVRKGLCGGNILSETKMRRKSRACADRGRQGSRQRESMCKAPEEGSDSQHLRYTKKGNACEGWGARIFIPNVTRKIFTGF